AVVSTDNDQMTTQMAKLFAMSGQPVPEVKYTFELNPDHSLVKKVAEMTDDAAFANWVELLLEQAMFAERGSLENPTAFIKRVNELLS
ncbi:molecular chaperone HtpG, partial [Avibacterium avium]